MRGLIVNTRPAIRFAHSAFSVSYATGFSGMVKSFPFLRSMIVTLRAAQSMRRASIPSTSDRRSPVFMETRAKAPNSRPQRGSASLRQ